MQRERTHKKLKTRIAAAFLALACSLSATQSFTARKVQATSNGVPGPVARSGSVRKIDDHNLYYKGFQQTKNLDIMQAADVNANGGYDYVYCVKANATTPSYGSVKTVDFTTSAVARELMGRITQVAKYEKDKLERLIGTALDERHCYIIKQIAIWNYIYNYQGNLPDSLKPNFNGIDINTLETENRPGVYESGWLVTAAASLTTEINKTQAPRVNPDESRKYVATISNKGQTNALTYNASTKKYSYSFTVNVTEETTGKNGGKFKFTSIPSGATVLRDGTTKVTTANEFTCTSGPINFTVETTNQQLAISGFTLKVNATGAYGDSSYTYALFANPSDANQQTYLGYTLANSLTYDGSQSSYKAALGHFTVNKTIQHPDGKEDVEGGAVFRLYSSSYSSYNAAKNAGLGWEGTTDQNGVLSFANIPTGEYKLTQVSAPKESYLMDPTTVTVQVTGSTSYGHYINEEKTGSLQIYKKVASTADERAGKRFDELTPESGAEFQVWNTKYSSYASAPAYAKALLKTAADGYSQVATKLPLGTYKVHQTKATSAALFCDDFTVTLTENNSSELMPYVARVTDHYYELNIQIRKVDSTTREAIPVAGVEFQVLASDKTTVMKTLSGKTNFVTGANGTVDISDLYLKVGTYYIKEIKAPAGYIKSSSLIQFQAVKGENFIPVNGGLKRVDVSDTPVSVTLNVTKQGELLTGTTSYATGYNNLTGVRFNYTKALPLEGVSFDLYCDTNVYGPDGKTFRTRNGVELKKGTKIGTYKTGADGKISVSGLYLDAKTAKASYYFVEAAVPAGVKIDKTKHYFNLTDDRTNQATQTITKTMTIANERQKVEIELLKVSRETFTNPTTGASKNFDLPLANAVFGIYADQDIYGYKNTNGTLTKVKLVSKDTLIEILKSDANGKAVSKIDLPIQNNYYVKELEAPAGFTKSNTKYTFKAVASNNTAAKFTFKSEAIPNTEKKTEVTLKLTKRGGQLVDATQNDTGYNNLKGYSFSYSAIALSGATFQFTCQSDVLLADRPISQYDAKIFPYVVKSADGKTFRPYAMFDKDGDGKAETPLKKGTVLGSYTTGADGTITVKGLSVDAKTNTATYQAVETKAPQGYILDKTPIVFTPTKTSATQTAVSASKSANNQRQLAVISFTKVKRVTVHNFTTGKDEIVEQPLPNAVFGLYANEDIYGMKNGKKTLLVKKDSLIGVLKTTANGTATSASDLPMGYSFYLLEIAAPAGYKKNTTKYIISTKSSNNTSTKITFKPSANIPNEDYKTNVTLNLSKTGEQLSGATSKDAGYNNLQGYDFTYSQQALPGAVFAFYCDTDVLDAPLNISLYNSTLFPYVVKSADGKTFRPYMMYDKDGDGIKETPLKKGTLLGSFTTNASGKISVTGLSVDYNTGKATYRAVETKAPNGYLTNADPVIFNVTRTSLTQTAVSGSGTKTNKRQLGMVSFAKVKRIVVHDFTTGKDVNVDQPLPNAVFGLYANEDIYCMKNGTKTLLVKKDSLIEVIKTTANGTGSSVSNIPVGVSYYLKEIAAPAGYVKSDDKFVVNTKVSNNTTTKYTFKPTASIPNTSIRTSVTLNLSKTGEMLTGVTDVNTGYQGMIGKDFTYSQLTLAGAKFEFFADSDVLDEALDISLYDANLFPYAVKSADGKTFRPYVMFDKDGDGIKETPLKKGTSVGTFTADANGNIKVTGLGVDYETGKATYKAIEVSAPAGYVVDKTPVMFEVSRSSISQRTVSVSGTAENTKQDAVIVASKVARITRTDANGNPENFDRPLAGAVIGVYAAEDIYGYAIENGVLTKKLLVNSGSLIEVIKSGANGEATTKNDLPNGVKFELREIAAPNGYIKTDDTQTVTTTAKTDGKAQQIIYRPTDPFVNTPVYVEVNLTLNKTGDMVTGTTETDANYEGLKGIDFTYSQLPLAGAKFEMFCDSNVLDAALDISLLDKDVFPYYEISADGKSFRPYMMFDKDGDGVAETPLKKGTSLGYFTTGENGSATFGGLRVDDETKTATYKAVEVSAPAGFLVNPNPVVFEAKASTGDRLVTVTGAATNETQIAKTVFAKVARYTYKDADGNDQNHDTPLKGAVIGIYTAEDIYGYELVNGVLTKKLIANKDTLIEVKTSDENGNIESTARLPMGYSYYAKELKAPEGFIMGDAISTVFAEAKVGSDKVVEYKAAEPIINTEVEVNVSLNLSKTGDMPTGTTATDTELDMKGIDFTYAQLPLAGAEFELYCVSDVKDIVGNYKIFNGIELKAGALLGTFKTDENGKMVVDGLKLDSTTMKATYKAVEISAPAGFIVNKTPVVFECSDTRANRGETSVSFSGTKTNQAQIGETVFAKVARYEVKDSEGKASNIDKPLAGAYIGIYTGEAIYGYKVENGTLTKFVIAEKDTLIEVGITDANGNVKSTAKLPLGYTYYAKELKAPQGFVESTATVSVKTEAKAGSSLEKISFKAEEAIIDKPYSVSISLNLTKEGEMLTGAEDYKTDFENMDAKRFTFSNLPLAGAEFDLYCNMDITDVDGSIKTWNDIELKEGAHLGTFTTNENGSIEIEGLQVDFETKAAIYSMIERSAPEGFIVDKTPIIFELSNVVAKKDQDVVAKHEIASNKRQNAILSFDKVARDYVWDSEKGEYVPVDRPLSEAVFGVYAKEDVFGYEIVNGVLTQVKIVDKDTLIEIVKTDDKGNGKTASALPLNAKFYIKELKAPEGYVLDPNTYDFETATKKGDDTTAEFTFSLNAPIVDELSRACIKINKIANDTKLPMQNVEFEVYTSDEEFIEKLVTDANGEAITKTAFPYGSEIILRETKTGKEYQLAPDERVVINVPQEDLDDYGIVDVTMINYKKSEIRIVKQTGDGKQTPMDGVTFQLWQKATVEGQADILIAEEQTDAKGKLSFFVPAGNYYLKETSVGKWTRFAVMPDPIDVVADNLGTIVNFNLTDKPTHVKPEKYSATNGKLLGNCGLSVKNAAGQVLTFVWDKELNGYVAVGFGTATLQSTGATQVLYTNNDKDAPAYGTLDIFGLEAGEYTIYEVEAPAGYRNDSQALKIVVKNDGKVEILRFYDSMKTGEHNQLIGWGALALCSVMFVTFSALAGVYFVDYFKRRKRHEES